MQLVENRQYREVIFIRINVQCPRLTHSALFINSALKRFESNPFMLKKKICRNLESGEDSRKLEAEMLEASLPSYFYFSLIPSRFFLEEHLMGECEALG